MDSKTIVTYIYSTSVDCKTISSKLEKELPVKFNRANSIEEIFGLLISPDFKTDFICVDIDHFYSLDNANFFEIVNTLKTLINCSPSKKQTKILGIVKSDTDAKMIKDSIKILDGIVLGISDNFTYEDIREDIAKYINLDFSIPRKVQDLLKSKNQKKVRSDNHKITLTPRQEQVLQLVANRGASNKVIAKILNISESTVKLHMSAIFKKYGVRNRTQLAVFSKESKKKTN